MKTLAFKKAHYLHGEAHQLICAICGEDDRNKLLVEDIGISVGMCGEDYSFCKKCWDSTDLGKKILDLLGYSAIKLIDESLELKNQ